MFVLFQFSFFSVWQKHPAVLVDEELRRSLQTFHLGLLVGPAASGFKGFELNRLAGKSPIRCIAIGLCSSMQNKHFRLCSSCYAWAFTALETLEFDKV